MQVETQLQESLHHPSDHTAAVCAVIDFARVMKNTSFYEVSHPVIRNALAETYHQFTQLLGDSQRITIKFVDGYVVVQDFPIMDDQSSIGNLVGACHRRGIDCLSFHRGLTAEEFEHLAVVLTADPTEITKAGGASTALAAQGVRSITVDQLGARSSNDWRWTYTGALDALRSAAAGVRSGGAIDLGSIQLSIREVVDNILNERSIVYSLNSMKGMDEYTFIHALHICILAIELGRQLNLPREQLEELGVAMLLHDVGKIFVPLEILRKPRALDDQEFALISRHPIDGAVALLQESRLPPVAAVVAFEHHIHYDHSGYPKLKRRRPLAIFSLMASVVDVYDALTTARPYRPPLPPLRAIEIMKGQYSGRLEPSLFQHFLRMLGPYPWGTLLGLSGGRLAVVTHPNAAAPENPLARLIEYDNDAPRLSAEEVSLQLLSPSLEEISALDPVEQNIDLTALSHTIPQDQ